MAALQMRLEELGDIPPGAPVPTNVTGELDLTQGFGPLDNGTYLTRGYHMTPSGVPYFSNASQVGWMCQSASLMLRARVLQMSGRAP